MTPVHEPLRVTQREPENRERLLYLLMVIAAISVILFSLLGIATMLGYGSLESVSGGDIPGHQSAAARVAAPGGAVHPSRARAGAPDHGAEVADRIRPR
jgi:hypothetical protein